MIRPLRSSNETSSHERKAEPQDDSAAELTCRCLCIEDAPTIEGAEDSAHAHFARHRIPPNFTEQGAVAVHRPMLQLDRHRRFGLDRHLIALGATKDRRIVLAVGLVLESTEPASATGKRVRDLSITLDKLI